MLTYVLDNPETAQWVILSLLCLCAFMMGYVWSNKKKEEIIEETIIYLCDQGYIKNKILDSGDTEILKIDED